MTPLARLLGLRVVVTHHGPDYDREKWNEFAKRVLRLGEWMGMRFSNRRIAISKTIQRIIADRHGRDAALIPNGVDLPDLPNTCTKARELGLVPGCYVLQVSRFVREKRQLDLIRAFGKAAPAGWKLALVGSIDRDDGYTREVLRAADDNPNVVLTGFQQGLGLHELFGHAGVFVLPSSHEGLPIALLEALSFGLPVLRATSPRTWSWVCHERITSRLEASINSLDASSVLPRMSPKRNVPNAFGAFAHGWRSAITGAISRAKHSICIAPRHRNAGGSI